MKVKKIDDMNNEYDIVVLQNNQVQIHKNLIGTTIEEIKKFRNQFVIFWN